MGFRHARFAGALLATTAVGIGVIEIAADRAAETQRLALVRRHPGLSVAHIHVEPFTGRTTLQRIALVRSDATITIGSLTLPGRTSGFALVTAASASPFDDAPDKEAEPEKPAGDTPAPQAKTAAAGSGAASAENVSFTSGAATFHIKRIDATGTSLTGEDLTGLVAADSSASLESRFAKLTAATIVVPEIVIDDGTAGSERHATITQVVLSGANAGKIASASAGSIEFAIKTGEDTTAGKVGAVQAAKLDLPQIARVFGTTRTDDGEIAKLLYDSVIATAIEIKNAKKNGSFTVASLKETGLKARPLKSGLLNGKDHAEQMSDAEKKAATEDFSRSVQIGSIEATGLDAKGDGPGGAGRFSIANVSMRDFAQAKIGGLALSALRVEGPDVKLAVGSAEFGPIVLPLSKDNALSADALMPSSAKADLTAIDVDVTTHDKDQPGHVQFKLGHAGFVSEGDAGELPRSAKLAIENLAFDLPPDPGKGKPLAEMGYQHLDLSSALVSTYDASSQELDIKTFSLTGTQMGTVGLGLHLANVTKGLISKNPSVAKVSALSILAKGITLDLANDGLFERAIDWKAKQDGLTVDAERQFLIDFFTTKLPAAMNGSANVKTVGNAVAKFVTQPKNLHIGVVSKAGLGVASMALLNDPATLIDGLEVTAAANQ